MDPVPVDDNVARAPTLGTRQRILDIAAALFSARGYAGTSMQDIADRLGTTKAALYYHFQRKEDILEALVRPALDGLDALLDDAELRPRPPAELLRQVVMSTMAVPTGPPPIELPDEVEAQERRFALQPRLDRLARLIAAGPDTAALLRAHAAIGAVQAGMRAAARQQGAGVPADRPPLHAELELLIGTAVMILAG